MDSYVIPQMVFSNAFEDLIKNTNKKDKEVLKDRCLQFLTETVSADFLKIYIFWKKYLWYQEEMLYKWLRNL